MSDAWDRVDEYIIDRLLGDDQQLAAARAATTAAGLPEIAVSAAQGRQLTLLAQLLGARRILEVGTLGGYSAICLARALPVDGRLVTLEIDPKHAAVARANVDNAGLGDRVEVREGPAIQTMEAMTAEGVDPFDMAFIDANKEQNAEYFEWALQHSRSGSLIVVDNVVRDGRVIDVASTDSDIVGTRRLFEVVGASSAVDATAIQTVGDKGYDGFLLAIVK
jgi:predicted O-methyltransferase YrrM